jgi:uncharacterized membrane protein YgdD (TMEM256/DUF423 family)
VPEYKKFLLIGAALAALGVLLGAFAAHGLEKAISDLRMLDRFETAVRYQFYHALGLILVFLLAKQGLASRLLQWSGRSMIAGILLFSGSLYIYVLSGTKWVVILTPIGGVFFIAAWVLLFIAAWKHAS